MRTIVVALLITLVCSVAIAENAPNASPAQFTVKAVDEDGNPLKGILVSAAFETERKTQLEGRTDSDGLFVAKCKKAWLQNAGFSINASGCYGTHVAFSFTKIKDGRWEPWNPVVTAVVRRVINPIPMYAKKVEAKIPITNTPCGYDLMVGDWVEPYGRGVVSDFVFNFNRRIGSKDDIEGSLALSFSQQLDGIADMANTIAESQFKLPRFAYDSGYQTNYFYSEGRKPNSGWCDVCSGKTGNYCLRVRSVADDKGNLKEAFYGKLSGNIEFSGVGTQNFRVEFTYYLNPTSNDRNMEFDPKRNLTPNLGEFEGVSEP